MCSLHRADSALVWLRALQQLLIRSDLLCLQASRLWGCQYTRMMPSVCNMVCATQSPAIMEFKSASIVASQCFCFCCRLCLYLVCLRMWHICHLSFKLGSPGHEIYACVMSVLQCWRTSLGLERSRPRRTMPLSCEHLCTACSCRPFENA